MTIIELDQQMADDRAHRIASRAAEDLIRCEGVNTNIEEYSIQQEQVDQHMLDCISHLCWHGEAVQHKTNDGLILIQLGNDLWRWDD